MKHKKMKFKEWLNENREPSASGEVVYSKIKDEDWASAGLRPVLVTPGMKKRQKKHQKK